MTINNAAALQPKPDNINLRMDRITASLRNLYSLSCRFSLLSSAEWMLPRALCGDMNDLRFYLSDLCIPFALHEEPYISITEDLRSFDARLILPVQQFETF